MATQTYTIQGVTAEAEQIFISTLNKRVKDGYVNDQIFYGHPAMAWLYGRKNTALLVGGKQFELAVSVLENPTAQMINYNQGLSMDDFDPYKMAAYWPVLAAAAVSWPLDVQAMNRGDGRLFSIIDNKIEITIETLRNTISQQLWNGTGTGVQANSIQTLIPATAKASQSTSVGGLSPSTYAWWRTQATTMSGLDATAELEAKMLNMRNTIEAQGGKVDIILTDQGTAETYEKNQLNFLVAQNVKIGDANFNTITYKGTPITFDIDAPAGELRMIDNRAITFCVDPQFDFAWTDMKEIPNVPFFKTKQVVERFQLARKSARWLGCIYSITAA
jgi:hypothetical protein